MMNKQVISPDGKWIWTGTEWLPGPRSASYRPSLDSTAVARFRSENVNISDGNDKEIRKDGSFVVNGNKLGVGRWKSDTRFIVQVNDWGGLWWVGELVEGGMMTICAKTQMESFSITPTNFEPFWHDSERHPVTTSESNPPSLDSMAVARLRSGNVNISDGNDKQIKKDGSFVVNGTKLGVGRWRSNTRFIVQVNDWGGLWWVGELVEGGMMTICAKTQMESFSITPTNFEAFLHDLED